MVMSAQMGSQPCLKKATQTTIRNYYVCEMLSSCLRAVFAAVVLKNVTPPPPIHPPTHTFLKWPFLTDFRKYTHTPPMEQNFGASDKKLRNP